MNFKDVITLTLSEDLINTERETKPKPLEEKEIQLILRQKMMEEISAQTSYRQFINDLKTTSEKQYKNIIDRIEEILNDEQNHYKIIELLLRQYSPSFVKGVKAGIKEFNDET
jgi:rubrerythrin